MPKNQTNLTNPKKYSNVLELFSKSYEAVKRNLNVFAILYFVTFALAIAATFQNIAGTHTNSIDKTFSTGLFNSVGSDSSLDTGDWSGGIGISIILAILLFITSLMLIITQTRAAQGKTLTFSQVWKEFKSIGLRVLGVELLMGLFVICGLVLLIIPGVYILGRIYLAPYFLVDKNSGIMEAVKGSWAMTNGHMWQVYSVLLFMILLGLTGIVPIVGAIISALLAAAYSVAPALRYFELKKSS